MSDVLIAGHSQVKYFHKYLDQKSNIDTFSRSGHRVEDMWHEISRLVPRYRIIVLHIGANNLPTDTVQDVLYKFRDLVNNIFDANPSVHIIISGLLPRSDNLFLPASLRKPDFIRSINSTALSLNNRLQTICSKSKRLSYASHSIFKIRGQIQRHLLSRDGLHLSPLGTKTVVTRLNQEVKTVRRIVSLKKSTANLATKHRLTPTSQPGRYHDQDEINTPTSTPYRDAILRQQQQLPTGLPGSVPTEQNIPTPYRDALLTPVLESTTHVHTPVLCYDDQFPQLQLPTARPTTKLKPTAMPTTQPVSTSTTNPQPTAKPTTQPMPKSTTNQQPTAKPTTKPVPRSTTKLKPTAIPTTQQQPTAISTTQPKPTTKHKTTQPKPTSKSTTKPNPAAKPTTKPVPRSTTKSKPTTQQQPTAISTTQQKPTTKHNTTQPKPTSRSTTIPNSAAKPTTQPLPKSTTKPSTGEHGSGKNIFGKLLMTLRDNNGNQTEVSQTQTATVSMPVSHPISHHSDSVQDVHTEVRSPVHSRILTGGGVVLYQTTSSITQSDIVNILSEPDESRISDIPPNKPCANQLYLIRSDHMDDWKCDQYQWINYGNSSVTIADRVLEKKFYKIKLPGMKTNNSNAKKRPVGSLDFKRSAYNFQDNRKLVLVFYEGNESVYVPTQHGNSKKSDSEFTRTAPSVLQKIEIAVHSGDKTAMDAYRDSVCDSSIPGSHQGVLNARNVKQVENIVKKVNVEKRISKDDIYNLCLLAYHMDGFIHEVTIFPDLTSIIALPEMISTVNQLLDVNSEYDIPFMFFYDTTFKLGDFYVSPLVFRNIIFEDKIYGQKRNSFIVKLPEVQQQSNGHDCGIYALANLLEFCVNPNINPRSHIHFDEQSMRVHLLHCLEQGHFIPFPKLNISLDTFVKIHSRKVDCSCLCGKPDVYENMIGCESKRGRVTCSKWTHQSCAGVDKDWFCDEHRSSA